MKEQKTPFLWSGSKDKNWKDIQEFIPDKFSYYIEPFVGGGSIYFRLLNLHNNMQSKLADSNELLINCYDQIKNDVGFIADNLPSKKDKDKFQEWRKDKSKINDNESAMRFLYMNRNRFFGLGGWMVADRYAYKKVVERIKYFSPRMNNTEFYKDAFDIKISPDDFVFCDPPYPETNNSACYHIGNDVVLDLNIKYLNNVVKSNCKFLFITKNVKEIKDTAIQLKCEFEIKQWTFRKPGKGLMTSEEIWIYKK